MLWLLTGQSKLENECERNQSPQHISYYVVAAVGMPREVCIITKAFDECGLHQHEMAFIHKEASKEGKPFIIQITLCL